VAELFVLSGADVGRSFEVKGGDTLGRSQDCILVLKDASISRRHAHLEQRGGAWWIVDDGSRNGIVMAGVKTRSAELSDGQEFLLGELLLRFRCEPLAGEPAAGPARAAAPAGARRPSAPPPQGETGEIVLEGAEEIELATSARPAASAASGARREGLTEQRGRILQYHRVPDTGSPLSFELSQLPAWQRCGLYLLGLLLLAAAAAAAFLGAAFVKDRLSGGAQAPAGSEREPGAR